MSRHLQTASKALLGAGLCVATLLVVVCVALWQRVPLLTDYATQAAPQQGSAQRLAVFDDIWSTIDREYYDPNFRGLDWGAVRSRYRPRVAAAEDDAAFLGLVESMLSELRDAHTRYDPPDDDAGGTPEPRGKFDVSLGWAEGRVIIASVEPGSGAARGGVKPGMTLLAVNGEPTERLFSLIRSEYAGSSTERAMSGVLLSALLYGGFLGPDRTLRLASPGAGTLEVKLERSERPAPPVVSARRLADGTGYVELRSWSDGVGAKFGRELARLRDTTGLVIDLRGNVGGSRDELIEVASNFFTEPVSCGANRSRSGEITSYTTSKVAEPYLRPVAILVDAESASASELFAAVMQEHGRALVIGRQTCGCVLNQTTRRVIGGGELSWSYRLVLSPKGRVLEGEGVKPDEAVPLLIADVRAGRDADLRQAVAQLKRRTRQAPSVPAG